tara:strand:+ start:98 stop:427 length:330 start_codon:yes stop_codon:yes gene_type:complete
MSYRENMIYSAVFGLAEATFAVSASIDVYGLNTAGTAITANLPAAGAVPQYKSFTFKDSGNNANNNNITIDGAADQRIDGQTTYVISTAGGAVTIISDGGGWMILSKLT